MPRALTVLIGLVAAQVGAVLLFRRQRGRHAGSRTHFLVTQGGEQLRPTAEQVNDAVLSVMMGGLVLDLREVKLTERPARIELLTIMGGVMILVPEDWKVDIDVQPLMAGVRDDRSGASELEDRPTDLVLTGRVIMGGFDVASNMHQEQDDAPVDKPATSAENA